MKAVVSLAIFALQIICEGFAEAFRVMGGKVKRS